MVYTAQEPPGLEAGENAVVLVGVLSGITNFKGRQTVRETWFNYKVDGVGKLSQC